MSPLIRVVKKTTNDFGPHNDNGPRKVDTSIEWEGTNLAQLSEAYPPSEIAFADPLGSSSIEDGLIRFSYSFEKQTPDGSWTEIGDPRTRPTADLSDYERAVDEENRRLFPGDYIEEDDEEGPPFSGDILALCGHWEKPKDINSRGQCSICNDIAAERLMQEEKANTGA